MIRPEDYYMFNLFKCGLLNRKVNMEKKNERQIIEDTIREAQEVIDRAKKSLAELDVTYSMGDRFKRNGDKYLLTATPKDFKHVLLVNLTDGCYWGNGWVVKNCDKITQEEMNYVCDCDHFTRYWDSRKKIYTGDKK